MTQSAAGCPPPRTTAPVEIPSAPTPAPTRVVPAAGPGKNPHHAADAPAGGGLPAAQDEVADRNLLGAEPVHHPLVHVLVMPREQGQLRLQRVPDGAPVVERP